MEKVATINTLSQFIDEVSAIELIKEQQTIQPKLLFRGQSNIEYSLTPSLGRRPSATWSNSWTMVEKELIQFAQQKFPLLFPDTEYPLIILAKLQHYGIPTRLLDLTENALVALYFACKSNSGTDGEVYAFQAVGCSAYAPIANVIADTYRLTENAITDISNLHYRAIHRPYYTRLLYPGCETDSESGQKLLMSSMSRPIFVQVGSICDRQKNQCGNFLLFPNKIRYEHTITDELISIEKDDPYIVKRIRIPKESKCELLDKLERFGVKEDILFSDDTDKVLQGIVNEQRLRYPD